MPRKRKQGERTPSTRLNDTVNQLSDGEFEDMVAVLRGGRKKRMYLDLILWHRGRQPYDADEEKDAFKSYDLNSMRDEARRQLDKVVAELRSGLPSAIAMIADGLNAASKTSLLESLGAIAEAKAHAIKRCYLERLVKLIELEAQVLSIVHSGENREANLEHNGRELAQARASLELTKEIAFYRSEYLEKVNETRTKTGKLDQEKIAEYMRSDFAKLDAGDFPPLLMSEKALLDEVFNGLSGNVGEACRIAEMVCEMDQKSRFLSPLNRAKLLVRLYDYYSALNDRMKGENLISLFIAAQPERPENRDIFLIRFLVVLLDWAIDRDDIQSFDIARDSFERNEAYVLASPIGGNRSRILIAMILVYLGQHDGDKARLLFDHLYRDKEQKPPLQYRISFLICHLMILYDFKHVDAIKQNAKNYREFMLEKGDAALPAIDLLLFLRKNAKRYAATRLKAKEVESYNASLNSIIDLLRSHQRADKITNRLFYGPFISWLLGKRI